MNFGKLGAGFGRLGGGGKSSSGGSPPPAPAVGSPIGLLIILTHAE